MKYLGKYLTQYVQDLCKENYKTQINDIKEEINRYFMYMDRKTQYCQIVSYF